jgi:hypothetical protein
MIRLLVVLAILGSGRSADAYALSMCDGAAGVSPSAGTLPPHARLWFYSAQPWISFDEPPTATNDGVPGKLTVASSSSGPYRFLTIDIDSDRTGALVLTWSDSKLEYNIAKTTVNHDARATTSRFHRELRHQGAVEVHDGLSIKLDASAVAAHVKLRRDDKAPWVELDAPVIDGEIQIGKLGCGDNYSPELLEHGVDLEVTLTFADGKTAPLKGLSHASIAPLPKPSATSP